MSAAYYTTGSAWLVVAVLLVLIVEGHVKARRKIAAARKRAEHAARGAR